MVLIVVLPRRLQILPRQAGDGVEHFNIRRPQIPSLHESPHGDARVANTGIAAAHARRFGDPARGLRRIERSGARVGILGSHGCSFLLLRHYTSPAGSGADSRPIKLPGQTVFLCLLNALVNHPVVSQRLLKATYLASPSPRKARTAPRTTSGTPSRSCRCRPRGCPSSSPCVPSKPRR